MPIEASIHLAKPFRKRQGDLQIKSPRARPGFRTPAVQQPWIRCSRCEPDAGPARTPSGAAAAAQRLAVDGERCIGRWRCIQPHAPPALDTSPNLPSPPPAPPQLASQLGAALQEAAAHANRDLLIAAAALLCAFGVLYALFDTLSYAGAHLRTCIKLYQTGVAVSAWQAAVAYSIRASHASIGVWQAAIRSNSLKFAQVNSSHVPHTTNNTLGLNPQPSPAWMFP